VDSSTLHHPSRGSLSEIFSTAIAGNDFSSSVLYVVGVTATMSGQLAPLCLLMVGFVTYLLKSVYAEVSHQTLRERASFAHAIFYRRP